METTTEAGAGQQASWAPRASGAGRELQLGRERALGSARPLRPKGGHHNRQWNPLASPARKSQLAQRDPVGSDGRTDGRWDGGIEGKVQSAGRAGMVVERTEEKGTKEKERERGGGGGRGNSKRVSERASEQQTRSSLWGDPQPIRHDFSPIIGEPGKVRPEF